MSLLTLFQLNLGTSRRPINYDLLRSRQLFADPLPSLLKAQASGDELLAEALPRMLTP